MMWSNDSVSNRKKNRVEQGLSVRKASDDLTHFRQSQKAWHHRIWALTRLRSPFYRQKPTQPDFVQLESNNSNWYIEPAYTIEVDQRRLNRLLFQAIRTHDHILIRMSLELGASPDARNEDNTCALALAIDLNDVEAAAILLKFAADANNFDERGQTVLFKAAARAQNSLVECLIESGASVDAKSQLSGTTSYEWLQSSSEEPIGLLGCPPLWATALDAAICHGYITTAVLLTALGAHVDGLGSFHLGPGLASAIKKDDDSMCTFLMELSIACPRDEFTESENFGCALLAAAEKGKITAVKLLLSSQGPFPDWFHATAITSASSKGHHEITEFLRDNKPLALLAREWEAKITLEEWNRELEDAKEAKLWFGSAALQMENVFQPLAGSIYRLIFT